MFYDFAIFGLAASSVVGLAAQCFVSWRRRLVSVAVRQGAGRRRAPGRPRLSGREAEAQRVQTARHRASRIYIYMLCSNTFRIFVFEHSYFVWRLVFQMSVSGSHSLSTLRFLRYFSSFSFLIIFVCSPVRFQDF